MIVVSSAKLEAAIFCVWDPSCECTPALALRCQCWLYVEEHKLVSQIYLGDLWWSHPMYLSYNCTANPGTRLGTWVVVQIDLCISITSMHNSQLTHGTELVACDDPSPDLPKYSQNIEQQGGDSEPPSLIWPEWHTRQKMVWPQAKDRRVHPHRRNLHTGLWFAGLWIIGEIRIWYEALWVCIQRRFRQATCAKK